MARAAKEAWAALLEARAAGWAVRAMAAVVVAKVVVGIVVVVVVMMGRAAKEAVMMGRAALAGKEKCPRRGYTMRGT